MKLTIWIEPEGEGGYVAECPELPGAVARGHTWDETLQEMKAQLLATFAEHVEQAVSAAREQLREPLAPQSISLEFAFVTGRDEESPGS